MKSIKGFKYFECGQEFPVWTRNKIFDKESKLTEFIKENNSKGVYKSAYYFNSENLDEATIFGDFYLDFDSKEDISKAKQDTLIAISAMESLGINENDIEIYFSGCKGFHLIISAEIFGAEPCKDQNKIYRKMALDLSAQMINDTLDKKIYDRRRLLRIENTINVKSGLYKIRLSYEQFKNMTINDIKKSAEFPSTNDIKVTLAKSEEAEKYYLRFKEQVMEASKLAPVTDRILMDNHMNFDPPCISSLIQNPIFDGERNEALLTIVIFLKNKGLNEAEIQSRLQEWNINNVPPFTSDELKSKIRYVFEKEYHIGCSTPILEAGCDKSDCPYFIRRVHLSEIQNEELIKKQILTEIIILGFGDVYSVPKRFSAECNSENCKNTCENHGKKTYYEISKCDKRLIGFCRLSDTQLTGALRHWIGCYESKNGARIRILDRQNVQELLIAPKTRRIKHIVQDGAGKEVDELGREYKEIQIYYTGNINETNLAFKAKGYVLPNPKNQVITILIHTLDPLSETFEKFQMTKELSDKFKIFQPEKSDIKGIEQQFKQITADLTYNVTRIYGDHRELMLGCILLTLHSVQRFDFDGVKLNRGWVEMGVGGDTAQGKSETWNRLSDFIDVGEAISGLSTSRTGLTYAIESFSDRFFIKWGKYITNDGKILFIDECQAVEKEELRKMSQGRSEGVIKVDRVVKGERNCRTRLIFSFNPLHNKGMNELIYGCTSPLDIFENPDIRRFDFIIFVASTDVPPDIIDISQSSRKKVEQKITAEVLRKHIYWAWTRKDIDIVFDESVTEAIIECAKRLKEKYGSATDLPLVSTDMKEKIARLSVALASLVHSTDNTGEKVIVKAGHVEYIEKLLQEIYDHDNCCLNLYARNLKESSEMNEKEYSSIWFDINNIVLKEKSKGVTLEMLRAFLRVKNGIPRGDLEAQLCVEKTAINERVKILKKYSLIKSTYKFGYMPTPKFIKFLKRSEMEGKLTEKAPLIDENIELAKTGEGTKTEGLKTKDNLLEQNQHSDNDPKNPRDDDDDNSLPVYYGEKI